MDINDYKIIDLIYDSSNNIVYRASRNEDNQPVILKILNENYPAPDQIARYKHEFEMISRLDFPGIVKVYKLEHFNKRPLLILEDF